MNIFKGLALPFLTRNMLNFSESAKFEIRVRSQAVGNTTLSVRGMTKDAPFIFPITTNSNGQVQTVTFGIGDVPVVVSVVDEAGSFNQGETYVLLDLMLNGNKVYQLGSGFVSAQQSVSWPVALNNSAIPGRGNIKIEFTTNPAAGAELEWDVPPRRIWKVLGLSFTLVAAAAAASRRVHVVVDYDGTGKKFDVFGATDQIISETKKYTASVGSFSSSVTNDNDILIPLPAEMWVGLNGTIKTETFNLNAGDDFGVGSAIVEEFFLNGL